MSKYLVLFCLLCALAHGKSIKTLEDDARKELEELAAIVESGSYTLAIIDLNFTRFTSSTSRNAYNDIAELEAVFEDQITILKQNATDADVIIIPCLNGPDHLQHQLQVLSDPYVDNIGADEWNANAEKTRLLFDVDMKINVDYLDQVNDIRKKLDKCDNDECIQSIIEEIQTDKTQIATSIDDLLNSIEPSVDDLRVKYQNTINKELKQYTKEANQIMKKITDCVDALIPDHL